MSTGDATTRQSPPPEEVDPVLVPEHVTRTDRMAKRLQEAYRRELRWYSIRKHGREAKAFAHCNKHTAIWRRLAMELETVSVFACERFINFCCKMPTVRDESHMGDVKPPTMFLTAETFESFFDYEIKVLNIYVSELHSDQQRFRSECGETQALYPHKTPDQCVDFVFRNKNNGLSPLFRFCYAWQIDNHEGVENWYSGACQQLLSDPEGYVEAWGSWLPQPLVDDVSHIIGVPLCPT